ncbi:MAG TPA: DUF1015 domain-containing protein, partial [Acidimicrobiales bacterium]|nr:DUF1015 domain-containing protein [Acidimicrobiales bacterium]
MPRFDAFRGVRYDTTRVDLADVCSPPYDVIDAAGRDLLAARHPANAVGIDLPGPGEDAYAAAAQRLGAWLADGTLRRDEPSLYVYQMTHTASDGTERHTTGVIGALELSAPGEGSILPHEHTTPKARSDRLQLLRATRANLSAVWALSPAAGLTELLEPGTDPTGAWSVDGVDHRLWRLTDADRIAAISACVGREPVVIADGHHRYETSLAYRDEQRALGPDGAPGAGAVLAFVVELLDDELEVRPIHRLVPALPAGLDLTQALGAWFDLVPVDAEQPVVDPSAEQRDAIGLVTPGGTWRLEPRAEHEPASRGLDSARVDRALSGSGVDEVVFEHDGAKVVGAVRSG